MQSSTGRSICILVPREHTRIRGIHVVEQIHACRRETPRCRERAQILLVVRAPLRMPG
jgi:hypothetical protein